MTPRFTVMISSTSRDLPQHREGAQDACFRQDMFPKMMEHLPASDSDAIEVSLEMVEDADIYVGIFGHRYGYVPVSLELNPNQISITEMEYQRAVDRNIPRLIFIMDKNHPTTIENVDLGDNAKKLKLLKDRLLTETVVAFFTSSEDLKAKIIQALSQYRNTDNLRYEDVTTKLVASAPEPYVPHPYTLLSRKDMVGREKELELLNNWIDKTTEFKDIPILAIVAIGGMGKSALTWKWFQEVAKTYQARFKGFVWWSFYEADSHYENFVIKSLAYIFGLQPEEIKEKYPSAQREQVLLKILDSDEYLFVLDGLERILIAYSRMDASRMDENSLDEITHNKVANPFDIVVEHEEIVANQDRLRKTIDPRAGNFLKKLAQINKSKMLISTRLVPADLQTLTGYSINGCEIFNLSGLTDTDAYKLWKSFGVSGGFREVVDLLNAFDNYPLLIRALASQIARYRSAPRDYFVWKNNNPEFDVFSIPLVKIKSHVLKYATNGLKPDQITLLRIISAFRFPSTYDILVEMLVDKSNKLEYQFEHELDYALSDLENRGLLGWNRIDNRYDSHPIIRGFIWNNTPKNTQEIIYKRMINYFLRSTKMQIELNEVEFVNEYFLSSSLDDLIAPIELFNAFANIEAYDAAFQIYQNYLHKAFFKIGNGFEWGKILESLFTSELEPKPVLTALQNELSITIALAYAYEISGRPLDAVKMYNRQSNLAKKIRAREDESVGLFNLVRAYIDCGKLFEAENTLNIAQKNLHWSKKTRSVMLEVLKSLLESILGDRIKNIKNLEKLLKKNNNDTQLQSLICLGLAEICLWNEQYRLSYSYTTISQKGLKRNLDKVRNKRIQSFSILFSEEAVAHHQHIEDILTEALSEAHQIGYLKEEAYLRLCFANLFYQQNKFMEAEEYLIDAISISERAPYPLIHTDALNLMIRLRLDKGQKDEAHSLLHRAFRLASCNGINSSTQIEYVYKLGLETIVEQFKNLNEPVPVIPKFNPE